MFAGIELHSDIGIDDREAKAFESHLRTQFETITFTNTGEAIQSACGLIIAEQTVGSDQEKSCR
jgi:hypothetical protein